MFATENNHSIWAFVMNPYNTSALEPPPGVIPNYNDPPTIAGALVAGLAIMIATATLAFAARVFTKVYVMKQVQLDDCKPSDASFSRSIG